MHYLIFIPGDGTCNTQKLIDAGLADHVPNASAMPLLKGPNNLAGTMFSWDHAGQSHYDASKQTWLSAVPSGDMLAERYLVGIWNQWPVSPRDLRWKQTPIEGSVRTLGDGQEWEVPCAGMLPQSFVWTRDGKVCPEVLPEFQEYFRRSTAWYTKLITLDDSQTSFTVDLSVMEYLLDSLRMNYRICREVANHLRLFTTQNIASILLATVAGLTIKADDESQKKSEPPADAG